MLVFVSCADSGQSARAPCEISVSIDHDGGQKLHGQPCTEDQECLYGRCHQSPAIAPFSFCTKECACGPNSACTDENGAGWEFLCQHFDHGEWPDEPMSSVCSQVCEDVSECPPGYTVCEKLTGARKVCLAP